MVINSISCMKTLPNKLFLVNTNKTGTQVSNISVIVYFY